MAYVINSLNKSATYVDDNGNQKEVILATIFIDRAEAISQLPSNIAVGSVAHIIGLDQGWQKNFDGTWKETSI